MAKRQSPEQLVFDLEPRTALDADDFLVADCNAEAVGWLDRFPDWHAPGLVIAGPPASGKSHLVATFLHVQNAEILDPFGNVSAISAFDGVDAIIIDDADAIAGHQVAEENVFHLFNVAKETGHHLLLTAESAPARWSITLPDLASRLKICPVAEIRAPDDFLLGALIVKQFHDRQLDIEPEVVNYALGRIERSFAAARDFVQAMDTSALARKRRITVPLARDVLAQLDG